MVSVKEKFSAPLESGRTNARNLPEELVVKILVHLDEADMNNLKTAESSV